MFDLTAGCFLYRLKFMESITEKAVTYFSTGYNCAQALFGAGASSLGLDVNLAFRIAAGFGGGMGMTQGACGAVTGALMAISYASTKGLNPRDTSVKKDAYQYISRFLKEFTSLRGTVSCRELINIDISTPEGAQVAREKNIFRDECGAIVKDAAEILGKMIDEIY